MSQTKSSWAYLDTPLERNYLWSLATTILPIVSSFIVSWIVARWAGPQVIGTVSWAMAFATAALIFGKFGMGLATSRLASEYGVVDPGRLRALFNTGLSFRLVFTMIVAVLAFAYAQQVAAFFEEANLEKPIRVSAFVILCASLYEFMEHYLIGLNRVHTVYQVRSVNFLVRVAITAVLVFGGWGAVEILGGYCVAWVIAIVVYLVLLLRYFPASGPSENHRAIAKRLLVLGVPLAASSASVTIFSQTDRLMIGFFHDMEEVGQYAIARNVTEVSLFPAFALIMTLRPALASRFSTGKLEECSQILQRTLLLALVFGVMFASIFAVFAVPLFTLVYSREFLYAGELMIFFIWVLALRSIGAIMLPALVAAERTTYYAGVTAISAAANFALNLVLIPSLRSKGAIIATLASYGLLLVLGLRLVSRIFSVRYGMREFSLVVRTVLAGALTVGVFWLLFWEFGKAEAGSSYPIVFVWLILQALIYTALISLFRVLSVGQVLEAISNIRKQDTKGVNA
ncbi:MAG: oligosaccharide flippase family protein [Candidatus Latescibacteria bacterium]|nr:oligosaccharide flippase family protein [Candidatus Latescibacterota bacterium]NIM22319.1 oligosaccharide flippase family protein [Candidatus Latescibacterota bacterium]NIM66148.1 oligosaccharide flippase family protein [Candidatus Latescibacterota bacterium]NIO02556.1 oligosaccharide flippase family protein [Candidatus Latescibacterota bacterium]NIO29470.1 oligosaccharide flippase family protein [Candidatus Latescibacterota bacterium]